MIGEVHTSASLQRKSNNTRSVNVKPVVQNTKHSYNVLVLQIKL